MKNTTLSIAILFLIIFYNNSLFAQWTATNTSAANSEVWDVESHNGTLFASKGSDGFIKSTDNGTTWNPVNQNGFTTNPISVRVSHILSAGSSLYAVTFNANFSSSMIYVSTDNGQNFVPDTVGIPKVSGNNECVNVDRIYYHNGQLVTDVANLGNWHKAVSGNNWVKNNHTQTQWSELFGFYNGKYFTHANYRTYVSIDSGQTWAQSTDTNLPSWFTASLLEVNSSSGRIYIAGKDVINQKYRLLYSDNEGASWDSIAINQYIGNNWLNQRQSIQALYAKGNTIEITLDNTSNSGTTSPSVLYSSNGGSSFTPDIAGLPNNILLSFGRTFAEHNGFLFMALSSKDVYKKTLGTSSTNENYVKNLIKVFPNPSSNFITISCENINMGSRIQIIDIKGSSVFNSIISDNTTTINTEKLENGIYFIQVETMNGIFSNKFIVNK